MRMILIVCIFDVVMLGKRSADEDEEDTDEELGP